MSFLLSRSERLRAKPSVEGARPFHIVLVEPEIPPNTGNIARLCGATASPLHLVGPLGFSTDAKAVRRAGLDYWHLVDVRHHTDLSAAEANIATFPDFCPSKAAGEGQRERGQTSAGGRGSRSWLFTGRASRSYLDVPFQRGDALVFGCESTGLPDELLDSRAEWTVGIPTLGEVRSLNLANSVAIGLYEALRQVGALVSPSASS